jgi:hypothetical protein
MNGAVLGFLIGGIVRSQRMFSLADRIRVGKFVG